MSRSSLTQYAAATAFALLLLTACEGGDVNFDTREPNFSGFANWPWPNNPDFIARDDFFREVQVEGHVELRLEALNGKIVITGQPDATSVMVTAVLRVGSDETQTDAEEKLAQLQVLVTDLPDQILIQTRQPEATEGRQYVVDYRITLPSDLQVDVSQLNGTVSVQEMANSVWVDAVKGSIDSTVRLPLNAEIRLSIFNGDIDLHVQRSTSAQLSAFVDNGLITWNNLDLTGVVQTNRSLSGTLGDGVGVIRLETTNGNIDLTGLD